MNKKTYLAITGRHTPKTPFLKNGAMAFLSGGAVCLFGEALATAFMKGGMPIYDAYPTVTVSLIFISATLTALGLFDRLTTFFGAGLLLPVTGFANSVTSSALDARHEGFILGVGAKIFQIAGPVILFGCFAGTVYGVIYYFVSLLI